MVLTGNGGDLLIYQSVNYFLRCLAGSKRLTEVTLPDGLETIGAGAFNECKSLTEITLPATLNYIGSTAFRWCDNLTTVICNRTTPPTLDNGQYSATFISTPASPLVMKIFVPAGTVSAYQAAWSSVASRIEAQ